ncbi:hypothetical protein EZS27_031947, partial [termite gut metagenome]
MSMKIKFKYVFLLFTLLGITACDEKEDPVISIDDSSKEITFSAAAGEKIITVK